MREIRTALKRHHLPECYPFFETHLQRIKLSTDEALSVVETLSANHSKVKNPASYIWGAFKKIAGNRKSAPRPNPTLEKITSVARRLNDGEPVRESDIPKGLVDHCLYSSVFDPNTPPLITANHFEPNYYGRFFTCGEGFFFLVKRSTGTLQVSADTYYERLKDDPDCIIPIGKVAV